MKYIVNTLRIIFGFPIVAPMVVLLWIIGFLLSGTREACEDSAELWHIYIKGFKE